MIGKFKCPECGNENLYLCRTDEISTTIDFDLDSTDFSYGKEEIIDNHGCCLQCGEGHVLTLFDGGEVSNFDEFKTWQKEEKYNK